MFLPYFLEQKHPFAYEYQCVPFINSILPTLTLGHHLLPQDTSSAHAREIATEERNNESDDYHNLGFTSAQNSIETLFQHFHGAKRRPRDPGERAFRKDNHPAFSLPITGAPDSRRGAYRPLKHRFPQAPMLGPWGPRIGRPLLSALRNVSPR
ncbi:hypothetical protein KM043_006619 [Ampulex compressa]|nr:hypothetical protein KM043_006619 [Ampulex compressa]